MLTTLLWLNLDSVSLPVLANATIGNDGDSISLAFNGDITIGSGGNSGISLTLSGGAATATYSSGDGTSTLVYSISRTIQYNETGTISYVNPGDGFENSEGDDIENFTSESITNNSSVGQPQSTAPTFHKYIAGYAGLTGALSTKKIQYLTAQGYSTGSLNDRMYSWLDATYTGSLNDMLTQWEADNLVI